MESLENSSIVRYKKDGEVFEIICNYENLIGFREKKIFDIYEVLCDDEIYLSVKEAKRSSKDSKNKVFSNKSIDEILEEIILNGECSTPKDFNSKKIEEIKLKVIQYIYESSINPQTKMKFSKSVIENEVLKVSYSYNPNKDYIFQAEEILKKLSSKFPIVIETKVLILKISPKYSGKVLGEIRKFGIIKKELWDNHSNLKIHIEVNQNNLDKTISFIRRVCEDTAEYHIE